MNNQLITQADAEEARKPRTRQERESLTNNGPAPVIFMGAAVCIALAIGFTMGGGEERTEDNFMTEVEYYQRQLDVQRAEFNGYRAGVNESRGQ